jgi:Holliday junction resolvasome RuvABC DNA-binding subunit
LKMAARRLFIRLEVVAGVGPRIAAGKKLKR